MFSTIAYKISPCIQAHPSFKSNIQHSSALFSPNKVWVSLLQSNMCWVQMLILYINVFVIILTTCMSDLQMMSKKISGTNRVHNDWGNVSLNCKAFQQITYNFQHQSKVLQSVLIQLYLDHETTHGLRAVKLDGGQIVC